MKRHILYILILSLAFVACGCNHQEEIPSPVSFYYCTDPVDYNSSEGVISAEIRDRSQFSDLIPLLNLYVDGPKNNGLRSPFPANIHVVSIETDEAMAVVCMNDAYAQLSGSDLTLACVCLSKTVMDLTNLSTVRIMAETQTLDANAYIEMTDEDFVFLDKFVPPTTS